MEVRLDGFDGDSHQTGDLLVFVTSFIAEDTTQTHLFRKLLQSRPQGLGLGLGPLSRDQSGYRILILRRGLQGSSQPVRVDGDLRGVPLVGSPPPDLVP